MNVEIKEIVISILDFMKKHDKIPNERLSLFNEAYNNFKSDQMRGLGIYQMEYISTLIHIYRKNSGKLSEINFYDFFKFYLEKRQEKSFPLYERLELKKNRIEIDDDTTDKQISIILEKYKQKYIEEKKHWILLFYKERFLAAKARILKNLLNQNKKKENEVN
jgi:hypothetical protein